MSDDGPRLIEFSPELEPHTNGHRGRRLRLFPGITFGVLLGSVAAASVVPRLQWLNLAQVGWWGRPVLAAAAAGVLVGAFRRDTPRAAVIGGAIAGAVSLWAVYGIVRLSVRVLFVERSVARVVAADLVRLLAYGAAPGAVGAAVAWQIRRVLGRVGGGAG